MQFVIPSNVVLTERKECYVEHQGQQIPFSVKAFTRTAFESTTEKSQIFSHINRYIESLSPQAQDQIFQIYSNIKNIFDTVPEFETAKWWHRLLHNQTGWILRTLLILRENVIVSTLPYHFKK